MHMISRWKKIIFFSVKLIYYFFTADSLFCTFENLITPAAMEWVCCKAVNLKFFGLWGHLSFSEQQSIAMILKTVRRYKDSKFRSRTWNANYEAKICVLCTHKWAKSGKISAIHNYIYVFSSFSKHRWICCYFCSPKLHYKLRFWPAVCRRKKH